MPEKIKLTKKNYEYFVEMCEDYIRKYSLDSWDVYYHFKSLEDRFAQTSIDCVNRVCTITLSSQWDDVGVPDIEAQLNETAKHEVMHILLGKVSGYANARFLTRDEMIEAEESLVIKLCKLL